MASPVRQDMLFPWGFPTRVLWFIRGYYGVHPPFFIGFVLGAMKDFWFRATPWAWFLSGLLASPTFLRGIGGPLPRKDGLRAHIDPSFFGSWWPDFPEPRYPVGFNRSPKKNQRADPARVLETTGRPRPDEPQARGLRVLVFLVTGGRPTSVPRFLRS